MVELGLDAVHVGEEALVGEQFLVALLRRGAQQAHGAGVERLEQLRVDAAEEGDRFLVPAPPEVVGELLEGLEAFG